MLFFDFKIILILGLSIAIYFIYREVETMHTRLLEIETKINLSNNIDMGASIILPMVQFTQPTKSIIVDFDETKADITSNLSQTINKQSTEPFQNKFIEVYSNDNSSSYELKDENVILPNISEHDNELYISSENQNIIYDEVVFASTVCENVINVTNIDNDVNVTNVDNVVNDNISLDQLNKMKMVELTNMALEYNISLTKMQNGVSKKKLKQELVNEIIYKKNI